MSVRQCLKKFWPKIAMEGGRKQGGHRACTKPNSELQEWLFSGRTVGTVHTHKSVW